MGFIKSAEEMAAMSRETFDFHDAEMLTVLWETKPETAKRLLPAPLKPSGPPIAMAFVANYPRTNFGVTYLEGALFLPAEYQGQEGLYCLAMPVTNDMALALGRESMGYPKKMANIQLRREGQEVIGFCERHGISFFEVKAKLTGQLDVPEAQEQITKFFTPPAGETNPVVTVYNFKYFPAPEGLAFDYPPRLVREEVELRPSVMEIGQAEVLLRPSDQDPWAEIEVVRVLGAIYSVGHNSMRPGKVVAEANSLQFAPYAFLKWDTF